MYFPQTDFEGILNLIHGTKLLVNAVNRHGQQIALALEDISIAKFEMQIIDKRAHKLLVWECYTDDITSLLHKKTEMSLTSSLNKKKNTAKKSVSEAALLDTTICKGERFNRESVLDTRNRSLLHTSNQQRHSSTRSTVSVPHGKERFQKKKLKII